MILDSVASLLKQVVPVSRFNKGEASKIFDEVKQEGVKVVIKNNAPICVLISIDKFLELDEKMEDMQLLNEALQREKMAQDSPMIKYADLIKEYNFKDEELAAADVEIE
ncbi:MAG TPA: prevent-host-death protein [Clostridiales bacterium]|nr:prevent-host-death protein [Clostridiales bacterium]